jgi:4-amino-4-deoxy-L-arabinose transferase-like glycosyltransferase
MSTQRKAVLRVLRNLAAFNGVLIVLLVAYSWYLKMPVDEASPMVVLCADKSGTLTRNGLMALPPHRRPPLLPQGNSRTRASGAEGNKRCERVRTTPSSPPFPSQSARIGAAAIAEAGNTSDPSITASPLLPIARHGNYRLPCLMRR